MNVDETVTLQELIRGAFLVLAAIGLVLTIGSGLRKRERRRKLSKQRRKCSQCGLWEEMEPGGTKFGTCAVCGGVTSRGRPRKFG